MVRELRSRLSVVASGADGGEGAHVFFFFGFPGTGKTYLAEQVAMAQHGSTAKPNYEVFSMQNYKTEEAMWNLVSPPCGVKGEGAFANLFASRVGCGGGGGGGTCEGVAPVVLFDEIEEARADFMTTALVNAVDKKGYVEFHRKEAGSDRCQSVHAPTAGAFFILTSNCFMDELNAVLADEQRPGRTPAQVYAAVRKAMDAKIFDEGIPCDNATRTPSPFAARKMADRMRGNIYPFLPLNDEEVVRAFETQLQHRADAYEATRGVGLYWTRGFARLIVDKALDGGDGGGGGAAVHAGRMRGLGLTTHGGGGGGGPLATQGPSLRKRLDHLMRLDERSVERLYATAANGCTRAGGALERLVLHVVDGQPSASPSCANGTAPVAAHRGSASATSSPADGDTIAARPSSPTSSPPPTHGVGRGRTADIAANAAVDATTDVSEELRAARRREAALQSQVEALRASVAALETDVLRWKLLFFAAAILSVAMLMGASQLVLIYAAAVAKATASACALSAALAAVAYAVAVFLCSQGSQLACTLRALIESVARWTVWLCAWAWTLFWQLFGGGWLMAWLVLLALLVWAGRRGTAREDAEARRRSEAWRSERARAEAEVQVLAHEVAEADAVAARLTSPSPRPSLPPSGSSRGDRTMEAVEVAVARRLSSESGRESRGEQLTCGGSPVASSSARHSQRADDTDGKEEETAPSGCDSDGAAASTSSRQPRAAQGGEAQASDRSAESLLQGIGHAAAPAAG